MRVPLLLCAASAAAQIVPPPGTSLLHADVGADHAYAELVTNVAPGLAAGVQFQEFTAGAGEPDIGAVTVVANHLAWRRNDSESQANLYLGAGVGLVGPKDGDPEAGLGAGFQLDWETRRLHAALMGHALFADGEAMAELKVHLGFAPWVATYDQVAPWVLLEGADTLGRDADPTAALVLVLMYQAYRLEAGVDTDGHPRAALRWMF